jgi:hypothetical protein
MMKWLVDRASDIILWVCENTQPRLPHYVDGRCLHWWHDHVCSPYDRWYIINFYPEQSTYDEPDQG